MSVSRRTIGGTAAALALALAVPAAATAETVGARLSGFQEVSAVLTDASGRFRAKIRAGKEEIAYRLSYRGFESPVRFAHIHFARRGTNGGVAVWLCDNTGNGPDGTPPCPERAGAVEGVAGAQDVVGPETQGLAGGDFDGLVDAIRAGATYVNVHSDSFGGGELRGQLRRRGGRDDDDKDDDKDND